MSLLLNIETATTVCSVSLSEDKKILAIKELDAGFTHAENLHLFIREIMSEASLQFQQLNAVAVSKGPGSYTGLRIGVSTAKGMAYALKIPLIGINTVQVMADAARQSGAKTQLLCPMIDARRMEVYTALFDRDLNEIKETTALILEEGNTEWFNKHTSITFFGDGMAKCRSVLSQLPDAEFLENIKPSARYMAELASEKFGKKEFEDVAYFEPFYLKEFIAGKKKQKDI